MNGAASSNGGALGAIAAAIGDEAAHVLAEHFGGTTVYVPREVSENHDLCLKLGADIANKIASWYGGSRLDVPKRAHRHAVVRQLARAGNLTRAGIARKTGYSERQIYRLLSEESDDRQPDLFE